MGTKLENRKLNKEKRTNTAKECAILAVFVALLLATQTVLSVIPGVELVTVLFVAFSFAYGSKKGMLAATAFSLIRQLVFGFFPKILILYLIYFNLLTFVFGMVGKRKKSKAKDLWLIVVIACLGTIFFTLFDNILTPIWYGYSAKATKLYFYASLPVVIPQVICTAVSVSVLFLPLTKAFEKIQ